MSFQLKKLNTDLIDNNKSWTEDRIDYIKSIRYRLWIYRTVRLLIAVGILSWVILKWG